MRDKVIDDVLVDKARDYILRLKFEKLNNRTNELDETFSLYKYLLSMDECNWKLKVGTK